VFPCNRRFEDFTQNIKHCVHREVVHVGILIKMWDIKHRVVYILRTVLKTNAVLLKIYVKL
jgi:hypothetical protein